MTPERWARIKELFNSALEFDPKQRDALLQQACGQDESLRAEIESLLSSYERGDSALEHPLLTGHSTSAAMLTADQTASPSFVPEQLVASRYRIVRFIGRGGMGEVYEAKDLELRERVALKTIRPEVAEDERAIERFKQEIHMARKVSHTNVCRIFDLGYHVISKEASPRSRIVFLTMELLAGETLTQRLQRTGRMTTAEARPLISQMAAGLSAAHAVGIVHRDFKSANVILVATKGGEDGALPRPAEPKDQGEPSVPSAHVRAVITDFGLARRSIPSESTTASLGEPGAIEGTPAYLAPEQLEGGKITPATDIYALGVVMFEMVTATRPFVGDTPWATAMKRLKEPPPSPRLQVPELDPRWEATILRCLERNPADRLAGAAEVVKALTDGAVEVGRRRIEQQKRRQLAWGVGTALLVAMLGVGGYFNFHRAPKLTERDTVVLADFTNTTGDPIFDGTLRQGLSAQLEQSPFLNLLSDTRVGQTLVLMAQPRDARLTRELALEVCQRTASAATIEGSIASLGSQYVLGLKAVSCHNGDLLAEEQVTAEGKEQVLKALGQAATKVREKLGESLASVEKFDAPPENVTTPSLEALQAYSLGYRAQIVKDDWAAAIPFFRRAISLDPNFAMAYARLATNHFNLGETARAAENTRKAYELRERVSEREKFYIASHYETFVTGDLEAARKIYELWAETYPRDEVPPTSLSVIYSALGELGKRLAANLESLKLNPGSGSVYANLVHGYVSLSRLDEAKAMAQEAQGRNLDSPRIHYYLYEVDFLRHDVAGMEREAARLMGKPGYEDLMLYNESDTAAYAGQFVKARALTHRAVNSAERADEKETAAGYDAEAAVREGLVGNTGLAKQQARAALALSDGRDVEAISAVALGLAGDSPQAARLANDLGKRFPKDTIVQSQYLPVIRAASILGAGNASENDAAKAIETLAVAVPYELGMSPSFLNFDLYPVYLLAKAHLVAHQGAAAAAEFQKILDHSGLVQNEPIGALAHLGLGRAYAVEAGMDAGARAPRRLPAQVGHSRGAPLRPDALARARAAYHDFFALWKDADYDIPIVKQAKAEYAKLK